MIMIGKNTLVFAALCAVTLQHIDAAPQFRFRPQWRYDEIELHYNNPSPYKTGEFDPLNINQDYDSRVYQPPYVPVEVDSNENNLDNDIEHGFNANESPSVIPVALPERVDQQQVENDAPVANSALIPEPIYEKVAVDIDRQKDSIEENVFDNAPIVAPEAIAPELAFQEDESSVEIILSEGDAIAHASNTNDSPVVVPATLTERVDDHHMESDLSMVVPSLEPIYEQEVVDFDQQKDVMEENAFDGPVAAPAAIDHEIALQEDESSAETTFFEDDNIVNAFNTNDDPAMAATLPDRVDQRQMENDPPMDVMALVPELIYEQEKANTDKQKNAFDGVPVSAPIAIVSELDQEDVPSARTTFSEEDDSEESQEIFPFAIFQQSSEESNEVAADDVARSGIIANKDETEEAETKSNIAVLAEVSNIIKVIDAENNENDVNDVTENAESSKDTEKVFEDIQEAKLDESQTEISFDEQSLNDIDGTEPSNVVSQVNLDESNKDFNIDELEEGADKIFEFSPVNDAQINIDNSDSSSNIAEDTTEIDKNISVRSSIQNLDAKPEIDMNRDEVARDETSGDNDFAAEEAGNILSDAILADQGSGDNAIAFDAVKNMDDSTELPDTLLRMFTSTKLLFNKEQILADDATETTVLLSQDVAEFEFNPTNINADDGIENATEAV